MLLSKSPGPRAGSQVLQRLGLPNSREWVAKNGFDKIESTKRNFPFVGNPEAKIFAKFRMKHREAHAIDLFALGFLKPEFATKFFEWLGLQLAALSSGQRPKKPFGVLR
ncbi:MAG: hypothetical protein QOE68_1629 [Thermoanaerobaculia bacterium]|nr:hypothetical protein [Thermoanaerobaculia bacterium]